MNKKKWKMVNKGMPHDENKTDISGIRHEIISDLACKSSWIFYTFPVKFLIKV